jgi:hypothetical protein
MPSPDWGTKPGEVLADAVRLLDELARAIVRAIEDKTIDTGSVSGAAVFAAGFRASCFIDCYPPVSGGAPPPSFLAPKPASGDREESTATECAEGGSK